MSCEDGPHERYADRKKKSQKVDLTGMQQTMFHGDSKRMEDLMKEYRNIQKEKRTEIAIDQLALKAVNEHKNRSLPSPLPPRPFPRLSPCFSHIYHIYSICENLSNCREFQRLLFCFSLFAVGLVDLCFRLFICLARASFLFGVLAALACQQH